MLPDDVSGWFSDHQITRDQPTTRLLTPRQCSDSSQSFYELRSSRSDLAERQLKKHLVFHVHNDYATQQA